MEALYLGSLAMLGTTSGYRPIFIYLTTLTHIINLYLSCIVLYMEYEGLYDEYYEHKTMITMLALFCNTVGSLKALMGGI